jgi:hypothetical protein
LEVIVGQIKNESHSSKIYLITEYGTIIEIEYSFLDKQVKDVKVTSYIKDMVCYKIRKILAFE